MARESRRTPFTGSAFVRSLAALTDLPAPASKDAFAERLCRWFDWTHAIALSSTLNGPAAPATGPGAPPSAHVDEREYHRVRATLVKAITALPEATAPPARHSASATPTVPVPALGFAPHRQHYLARQQAMDAAIGPLRRRVRATLAGASPAMARLAAVDAIMEQVVGPKERTLLSAVPASLERHFDRLCPGRPEAPADPSALSETPPSDAWLDRFRQDLQGLLLAELDFRLQPVEGLLEALRRSSTDRHE